MRFFEGVAGTGKTTSLMEELSGYLLRYPLADGQAVLAVTYMHGSRRRLADRLRRVVKLHQKFECVTIDSFAWRIVSRWRGFLNNMIDGACDIRQWDFERRCAEAARVLAEPNVARWVFRRFPLVVADELQDVKGGRLGIIQGLSTYSHILAAADEFQDLMSEGTNEAVEWLRSSCTPTVLSCSHRTSCMDLLSTARELRDGQAIDTSRSKCRFFCAPNPNVAAGFMATNLTWFGVSGSVILTPAGPQASRFVRDAVDRLRGKAISPRALKGKSVGPFAAAWESHVPNEANALCQKLDLQPGDDSIDTRSLEVPLGMPGGRLLQEWINRQRRVLGRVRFPASVVREEAVRACQLLRSIGTNDHGGLVAMTIHQAKNREFDRVLVLWPYEVSGTPEMLRRLLYNAITRARKSAIVIVQDPPKRGRSRLALPPFGVL